MAVRRAPKAVLPPSTARHNSAVGRREQRGDTHRGPRDDDRLGMSGLRELVEPGTQLLPAVPSRCAYCGAAGGRLSAHPPVLLPECFARTADVRRAGAGADPTAHAAERVPASDAGRGRPRARRSGRCTDGLVLGVPVSRSTVLRLVAPLPEPKPPASQVVGVVEYATRKGCVYATVWSTSRPGDPWTFYLTVKHPAWPGGSPSGPASRSSAEIELPSSRRAPRPGRPKRSRSPTGGICGTTSERPPSEPSPATASAYASWPPSLSERRPRSPPRRPRTRRGRVSGSPTVFEPGTPRSTRCWKPYHSRRSIGCQVSGS